MIRGNLKEVTEENQCGLCRKKTWVLISYSSFYDTDICKTCYLKLKVRHRNKEDLYGQRSQLSFKDGTSRSMPRLLNNNEKRKQG